TTGTATCNASVSIPTSQTSVSINVGTLVGGWYIRNSQTDDSILTVSLPLTTNFITGGGYLNLKSSSGLCAGAGKNNFGFNVKYNKGGSNLQGGANIIIRSPVSCTPGYAGPRVYQIKTNS